MLSEISELQTPSYIARPMKPDNNKVANEDSEHSSAGAEKQEHHLCLFWGCNLANFMLAGINIVIFFNKDQLIFMVSTGSLMLVSITIFLLNTCFVAPNKKAALCLYFLLDNLILVNLAALVGFIGMVTIIIPTFNFQYFIFLFFLTVTWIMYTGNYRVTFAYTKWTKWQVICGKLSLILSSLVYLAIATYFMRFSFDFGQNVDSDSIKDFFFLYIFGLLSLLLQIYSKISDLDGTANLSFRYSFQEEEKLSQQQEKD